MELDWTIERPSRAPRLLVLLTAIWLLLLVADGYGQFHADSSEMVLTTSLTPISSTLAPPIRLVVASGDGAKFARIGAPLQIAFSSPKDSSYYFNWELDSVSGITGDTLIISYRKLSTSRQLAWAAGSWVRAVGANGVIINQLKRQVATVSKLPDTTGNAGKYLQDAPGGVGPSWQAVSGSGGGVSSFNGRTGAVTPSSGDYNFSSVSGTLSVAQGGTGLTSVPSGDLLYASSANVFSPLMLSTGLSIVSGTLTINLTPYSTTNLAEGSNLYYTNARARAALSATSPVLYDASTGIISERKASNVNDGYISASDWTIFNAKQNMLSLPLSVAQGGTGATNSIAALTDLLPDTSGHAGHVLSHVAGGDYGWISAGGGGGTGTVTSVAATAPSIFSVTGTPITTSGTLAFALTNEAQNSVFAGPSSGGVGVPLFRSLQAMDIPNFPASQITSGTLAVARGGTNLGGYATGDLLYASSASALATLAAGATNQVLTIISGLPSWQTPVSGGTVNSVGISGPSIITWTNTPVTNSGTLTGTLASQLANLVLASPNGSTGVPVFRSLANADLANGMIQNAKLANASVTISTGTGLSGGGAVSLGASLTLTNTGVTSVDVSGGTTGLTTSGGPVTNTGTVTISGTLTATSGGTNQSSYATGDLLYASAANTLSKRAIGTAGQVLTITGGVPTWATTSTSGSGGTITGDVRINGDGSFAQNAALYVSGDNPNNGIIAERGILTEMDFQAWGQLRTGGPNGAVDGSIEFANAAGTQDGVLTIAPLSGNWTWNLPDASGTLALVNQNTTGTASNVTGIVAIANGGTGSSTQQTAINALTGTQSSGKYLRSNGTNASLSAIATGDVPTLNQNTTGSAAKWTTARNLAGNAVDGSADVPFANKFIVQGTTDAGLSGAQFLGSLATGILKNTTSTGVLSIAAVGDFPTFNQSTTGSAATLSPGRNINSVLFDGSSDITVTAAAGTLTGATLASGVTNSSLTTLGTIAAGVWNGTIVTVGFGGTGASSLTSHGLLLGHGTSAITALGAASNGQVAIGSTGADPILAALTPGAGIAITNAAGSITIATSGVLINPMTTTGDVIYSSDNSGTSARLAVGTSSQFLAGGTTPTWNDSLFQNGIAATSTAGIVLANTTASTSGVPNQFSPSIYWVAHERNTTTTAADSTDEAYTDLEPSSDAYTTTWLRTYMGGRKRGFPYTGFSTREPVFSVSGAFSPNSPYTWGFNAVLGSRASTVANGLVNSVCIGGGAGGTTDAAANSITGTGNGFAILGGLQNSITGGGNYSNGASAIIGGNVNAVASGSYSSVIIGGSSNSMSSQAGVIVGGNLDTTDNSALANGNPYLGAVALGGRGLYPRANGQVVVGQWNKTILGVASATNSAFNNNDARLIVGNGGTASSRSNALVVYGNGKIEDNVDTIGTTYTNGLVEENQVPATASVTVQQSPSLDFLSHVWSTTTTAHDSTMEMRMTLVPTSSANPLTSTFNWDFGNATGGFTNKMSLTNTGVLTVGGVTALTSTQVLGGPNTSQASPTNPTGTTSATGVMMGLAGTITPSKSGVALIIVSGNLNSGATGNPTVQIRHGGGTAPTNGGTPVGNVAGSVFTMTGANGTVPFTCTAILSGLTLVAHWIDLVLISDGTSTATVTSISISAYELK